jgi:Carboxypeptidase regulatory-like domain
MRLPMVLVSGLIPVLILSLVSVNKLHAAIAQDTSAQGNATPQKPAPEPGRVSGHVYRADTGAAIAKAEIVLIPTKQNSDVRQDPRFFTTTDADGAFLIKEVGPGTYAIGVKRAGFVSRDFGVYEIRAREDAETFTVGSGQVLDRIDVRLVPAGIISGTISDEDNQPIAAVLVEAVRLSYARGGRQLESSQIRVWTDDLGNFRLYGLPRGNYFVRAEVENVSAQAGRIVSRFAYFPGTTDVENAQPLKVTPGDEISGIHLSIAPLLVYSITGNIVDVTGLGGPGRYQVTAMSATDLANNGGRITSTTSASDGSFTLRGMPSGVYTVGA